MNILKHRFHPRVKLIFLEALILIALVLAVFSVNEAFLPSLASPFNHQYQVLLPLVYPAVFFAAGYGLSTTDVDRVPGLSEFIYGEADSFDIGNIPNDLELKPIGSPVVVSHRYYLWLVGWIWRVFGVSLDSLILLSVLLRVLCAGLLYGLFRVFLGRFGTLVGVLFVCCSPAMLHTGMSTRDFSKAPFLFAVFLILALLARRSSSRKCVVLLSSLLGLVVGTGVGFRQDLLICVPPVPVTLLFFARIQGDKRLLARGIAVAAFCLFLSLASYPIVKGTAAEGNQTIVHSLLLGVSPGMEAEMDFGGASYDLMPSAFAGDSANLAAVNVYARRMGNRESMLNRESAEYQRYSGDKKAHLFIDPYLMFNGKVYARFGAGLVRDMVVAFPADFVSRAWCATTAIFTMPEEIHERVLDAMVKTPPWWLDLILSAEKWFAHHMAKWGFVYTGVLFLALSGRNLVLALFCTGMLVWFTGYTSILYEYRHTFYLVFIPVLVWLVCIRVAYRVMMALGRRQLGREWPWFRKEKSWVRRPIAGMACYVMIVSATILVPLFLLRGVQGAQVNALADDLLSARMIPVPLEDKVEGDLVRVWPQTRLPQLEGSETLAPGETAWEYMALVFETHGRDIPVTLRYNRTRVLNDLSQDVIIKGIQDGRTGRTTFFFPVYESGTSDNPDLWQDFLRTYPAFRGRIQDAGVDIGQKWWARGEFEGISFPKECQGFFAGMFRVSDIETVRMLPLVQVPDDRRYFRWFKTCKCERYLQTYFSGSHDIQTCNKTEKQDASCWQMDEVHAFHPVSPGLREPLLEDASAEAYHARWNARITYYPGLAKIAALDIANAGTRWCESGETEEALKAYLAAREFDPEEAVYPLRLGQIYLFRGEPDEAVKCFQDAIRLQPLLPDTAAKVDQLFDEHGKSEAKESFWMDVFSRHPDSWFAGMRLGGVLESTGKWGEAAGIYDAVHKVQPDHPDTSLALARCLGRAGRVEEAFGLLEETAEKHADYRALVSDHLVSLGEFLGMKQEAVLAEDALTRAVKIAPGNASLYLRLGDALRVNGKTDEAVRAYKAGLDVAGGNDSALRESLVARVRELQESRSAGGGEIVP